MLKVVGSAVSECEVCTAFEKAPRLPAAGSSPASAFNGNIHADLCFLGNLATLRAAGLFSRNSTLVAAPPKKSTGHYDRARCGLADYGTWEARLYANGQGRQMEKWSVVGTRYSSSVSRKRISFLDARARNGLVRGISNRLEEDGRFADRPCSMQC